VDSPVVNTTAFRACCGVLAAILFSAFACCAQDAILTNATSNPDGSFQAQLMTTSGKPYTIESSRDLLDWNPDYCFTNVTDKVTFWDAPMADGSQKRFYRARTGTAVTTHFSFVFSVFGGAWATGWIPSSVPVESYAARLVVENDTNYPAAASVLFTGPPGSGLTNSPASASNGPAYEAQAVPSSVPLPTGGVWRVTYKGTNLTFNMPNPQAASRLVIPFPTVSSSNDSVNVSWVYRDAQTGQQLNGPPAFVTQIQATISGCSSVLVPAQATSVTIPTNLPPDADVVMTYIDTFGNGYAFLFAQLPP
jgi:hypothetical protein